MVARAPRVRWDSGERGGALLASVVAIVVVYTLFGALALAVTAQHRFITRDHLRRQAAYVAEAGIYTALTRIGESSPVPPLLPVLDGDSARVSVRTHGAFYLVTTTATAGDQSARATALLGADPGPLRDLAVGSPGTGLVLGGGTRITGAASVGGDVETSLFNGQPFYGAFEGAVLPGAGLAAPSFPLYDRLLDALLQHRYEDVAHGLPLRVVEGDLLISTADSAAYRDPVVVVATGRLTIAGPLSFASGAVFAALDTLDVLGHVEGEHGLFASGQAVRIGMGVPCSGQFVGRRGIQVASGAALRYPSVLYARDAGRSERASIVVRAGARVDGTVIAAWPSDLSDVVAQDPAVTVEPGAHVRGAVLSAGPVDLRGAVEGSVVAGEFVVVDGYSTYHNWIVDASVLLDRRPDGYALPVSSNVPVPWGRLTVVAWLRS